MSENTSNVEFAHRINETHEHHHTQATSPWARWVSVTEAIVLSIVAVATAWSGYQAARWDAASTREYSKATSTTVRSQVNATLAGQDRLYDIVTFNGWIAARTAHKNELAKIYERRFRPEYAKAFTAWQKLDPFNNPSAPPGPVFMPEYANAHSEESARLAETAKGYFDAGVSNRETGDAYVRITVFLATVLLLTALSQRFEMLGARVAVLSVAFLLLLMSGYWLLELRRA
jgi:hypothetical protein